MGADDPQYRAPKIFTQWNDTHDDGMTRGVNVVPKLTICPSIIRRKMPLISRDNETILNELGLYAKQVKALFDKGVIKRGKTELGLRYYS